MSAAGLAVALSAGVTESNSSYTVTGTVTVRNNGSAPVTLAQVSTLFFVQRAMWAPRVTNATCAGAGAGGELEVTPGAAASCPVGFTMPKARRAGRGARGAGVGARGVGWGAGLADPHLVQSGGGGAVHAGRAAHAEQRAMGAPRGSTPPDPTRTHHTPPLVHGASQVVNGVQTLPGMIYARAYTPAYFSGDLSPGPGPGAGGATTAQSAPLQINPPSVPVVPPYTLGQLSAALSGVRASVPAGGLPTVEGAVLLTNAGARGSGGAPCCAAGAARHLCRSGGSSRSPPRAWPAKWTASPIVPHASCAGPNNVPVTSVTVMYTERGSNALTAAPASCGMGAPSPLPLPPGAPRGCRFVFTPRGGAGGTLTARVGVEASSGSPGGEVASAPLAVAFY